MLTNHAFFWLALVLASCGSRQPAAAAPDSTDPCFDADIAAKRVWNDETRVQINARIMSWGGQLGTDVAHEHAEQISSSMDRLTDDWARMRRAVCKDHFTRQTLTKAEYQQRADCLDRLLARQRTFLESLSSPLVDASTQLASMSEELDTCR
jgi:hypothetical protein